MKLNQQKLISIINIALDSDSITLESTINNTEGWDSLSQLSILTELDDALDGKVTDIKGIADVESVEQIINLLRENALFE